MLSILVIVAGTLLLRGSVFEEQAMHDTTRASLVEIRDAICGYPGVPGFEGDLAEPPTRIGDLFTLPPTLPSGKPVAPFDRITGRGWNGPYFVRPTGTYTVNAANGFTAGYGSGGDPALLDAWQRPIVIQRPTTTGTASSVLENFTRVVSAGPDGVIDTPADVLGVDVYDTSVVNDDLVVYLFRANGI